MTGSDRNERPEPLAMAKGNSPWGSGGKDGEVATDVDPGETEAPGSADEAPRNPWLVPDTETSQRRSASIDDIFRSRNGGSSGSRNKGPASGFRWLPWLVGGSIAAWLLATSVHVLAQDERAMITTMGRYSDTVGPGLHLTMPWPLQSMLRQQTGSDMLTPVPEKDAEALMPTADGELIDVKFQVRWRIADLKRFTFNLPDGEAAVRRLADAELRSGVAEMTFEDLWSGKRQAELQQDTMVRIQRVLDAWHAGVSVSAVEVIRFEPPGPLSDTFKRINDAKAKADKVIGEAQLYRDKKIKQANGEVDDFNTAYASYKVAPVVTRRKMYDEMMARVVANNPVVVGATGSAAVAPPAAAPAGKQ